MKPTKNIMAQKFIDSQTGTEMYHHSHEGCCCRAKRGSHLFLTTFTVFTRARSPRDLCILAKANLNLFVVRSFGSHFLTSQNDVVYKFLYARSLRWQSDHFRKLCSVHRGFIGAMTFNFDMTIWHIAYISIARGCLTFMQYKYYLILEEKSYIFEGMLIKIVIWTFEYFYICIKWTWYTDSLFLIHLYKHSNSISSRCIFWCVFVAIIWSNQIKRDRLY